MTEFEVTSIPTVNRGRNALFPWDALVKQLKELADNKAIRLCLPESTKAKAQTVRQALQLKGLKVHSYMNDDGSVSVWEKRNGGPA